ncbi:RlpA-like double-psi beta-barrel domain-containing protein, partial [Bacillus cereus group sp. BC23]
PFCGKGVIIKVGGREVKAVVQDKCQACGINDIDVSQKVFREVFGSLALGRGKVEWWLED